MKISLKLISGFLVVILIVAIVGYISFHSTQNALQGQIAEESLHLANKIMAEIDKEIYIRIEGMQAYSEDVSLAKAASVSSGEFDKMPDIQNYIGKIDKDWKDKKDTPFIQSILNSELSGTLTKHLEFYKQRYGYAVFAEVYVTNKYGVVIASTGRTTDYLQADEEWYQKAVREKEFWAGDVEYDESSDALSVDIVINLYDNNENFVGLFKGVLNLEDVKHTINLIRSQLPYEHVEIYFVDKNGLVIFSGLDQRQKQLGRDVRLEEFGRDFSSREAIARAIQRNDGSILVKENGRKLLTAFSYSKGFKDFKGLGWSVIIDFEADEVFTPIEKLRKFLAIVFIFAVIITVFIGSFIARSISKPIETLTSAIFEIGKGNLDIRTDIKSRDEIGQLAASFNKMAEDLQHSMARLVESNRLSITDALTGTYNRRFFDETLNKQIALAKRHKGLLAVFFIDVDYFKNLNDTYGHAMGDKVLQHVSRILKDSIRVSDILCRHGGDEFVTIMPTIGITDAVEKAEKIRYRMESMSFNGTVAGNPLRLTISIGVASFPEHGADYDTLVRAADSALYKAKKRGRNRVETP